jgi:hypothetical protein
MVIRLKKTQNSSSTYFILSFSQQRELRKRIKVAPTVNSCLRKLEKKTTRVQGEK